MLELQFSSLGEFFSMGNYAFNVWSVYALFALFFVINIYFPLLRRKQILKEQKRRLLLNTEADATTPAVESAETVETVDRVENAGSIGS